MSSKQSVPSANIRVVAMPSWELFERQSQAYRDRVLPPECTRRIAVEAGTSFGWERYVGDRRNVLSVEKDAAAVRIEASGNRIEQCGFTGTRFTNQENEFLWLNMQSNVIKNRLSIARIRIASASSSGSAKSFRTYTAPACSSAKRTFG